ncbi:LOW QUALITY PROTEIN: cathelicidin antimicrobial peptide [Suncus etruscus]|uniref:LOW QUALITY PROTEIN: cathelicidin antimicrobial peptide n=1 Tax=Suncus etruscus TaxID=109475 RepID=UPI0021104816|nr:LOW QUALITY PROTEIN: cathelicidin antimicrobial peptide [Suncus etruscus]
MGLYSGIWRLSKTSTQFMRRLLSALWEDFNQQSSESNYFRLLELNQRPNEDEDPSSPQPIPVLIKETVCSKTEQQPLQLCDFKEKGSVRQCVGTVTLDSVRGSFDINCEKMQGVGLFKRLKKLIKKGGQKIRKLGRKIKDFIRNLQPRVEPEEEET